jgi:hypothetical protein
MGSGTVASFMMFRTAALAAATKADNRSAHESGHTSLRMTQGKADPPIGARSAANFITGTFADKICTKGSRRAAGRVPFGRAFRLGG